MNQSGYNESDHSFSNLPIYYPDFPDHEDLEGPHEYQRDCLIFWEDYLHPQRSLKAPRRPEHKLRHLFHKGHIEPQSVIVLRSNSGRNSSHWRTHVCHDIRPSSHQESGWCNVTLPSTGATRCLRLLACFSQHQ